MSSTILPIFGSEGAAGGGGEDDDGAASAAAVAIHRS